MRKIIIDCDPGHDDAMAVIMACSEKEKLNILAVGTVGGNHHVDRITKNAQLILQTLEEKIPLYAGCGKPLLRDLEVQPHAHGDTGMDGLKDSPVITYTLERKHAVEAYRDILTSHKEVTLVALGPLTNIALLLHLYPELNSSIEAISLMGGGIDHGNITPYAEFNIYADPEAAKMVFNSGVPIIMSGLDVTEKAYLELKDIESLKDGGKVSYFSYELLKFYHESGKQFGFEVSALHDVCAVAVLLRPELFTFKDLHVEISCQGITRGMTCGDLRLRTNKKPNARVVMDVDQKIFAEYVLQSIKSFDGM